MASILTGAEVKGNIPGGGRSWSREAQRCESAVEMRGMEKDPVYRERSWAGGDNDGNKNNNNSNGSKHTCTAYSTLRHRSTHFTAPYVYQHIQSSQPICENSAVITPFYR